jgi:hypothetical protein
MSTDMKSMTISILLLGLIFISDPLYSAEHLSGDELIVGYYGRPGAPRLGILGQHSIEELTPLVQAKADEYGQLNSEWTVVPAFHLIYGLAAADPGRRKDYILPLSHDKLMQYINAAQSSGFLVFIDTQLGALTPVEAVNPVLQYLKYDNVHLAIDPEFEVENLDVRPGKVIGHVTADEVNEVQKAMSDFLTENGIEGNKILMVHSFTDGMVQNKPDIEANERIRLILNLDGHGSPELKVKIYNGLYTKHSASRNIAGGFKLFFQEDKPAMMTPGQVMALEPVGKSKIGIPPTYINYQ